MGRWAPDARERLEEAALALFSENGYDATTIAQIADRAGLNRATFFRHFADKREILFGGEDVLARALGDAISGAGADSSLIDCLDAALAAAGDVLTPEQKVKAAQRRSVAATSAEVQERALLKGARISHAIASALRERGVDELTARLGAELTMLAFGVALERWIRAPGDESFAPIASDALEELHNRAASLGAQ